MLGVIFLDTEREGFAQITVDEKSHAKLAKAQGMVKSIEHISPKLPWYIPFLLVLSIFITALVKYFNKSLGVKSPIMKAFWMYGIEITTVSPLMFYEMSKYGSKINTLFTPRSLLILMLCQIFKSLTVVCDIIANGLTTSANCAVLAGFASIILHVWKRIKG